MNRPASITSFSWLDYDEEESRRARELLAALDAESVDALGLGSIRDGFANLMFPGTSTIQTRVRYFLLVPYAAQVVASRGPRDIRQFDNWFRQAEWDTMDALKRRAKRRDGVIGFDAGHDTQRLPSEVYWNGMAQWGIVRPRAGGAETGSLSEYRAWVLYGRRALHHGPDVAETGVPYFDELPSMPEQFPGDALEILPTKQEGRYLLERMQRTNVIVNAMTGERSSTLLAAMAADLRMSQARSIFELDPSLLDPMTAELLWHAVGFSTVAQGARLLYNRMLCEDAASAGFGEFPNTMSRLDRLEAAWIEDMFAMHEDMEQWRSELTALFTRLRRTGVRISGGSERFVRDWSNVAVADPEQALESDVARSAIRGRESAIKRRGTARLRDRAALERWRGALFGQNYMDFRFGTAQRHISDCHKGSEE